MKLPYKCLAAVLCGSLLCPIPMHDAQAEVNQVTQTQPLKDIPFTVYKQNSQDVSVMNDYMEHPATIRTENDKLYLRFKLLHPEWWQAFELYEGDKQCEVKTLSETKEARLVEVEVSKDTKSLTSKVHIIVPDIHYDHHYTTKINLEASLAPNTKQKVQHTPKADTTKKVHPKTPSDKPEQEKASNQQATMQSMDFKVMKHKTNELSVMDQYMIHPAKVSYHNQQATVQMTLNHATWWQTFELYDGDKAIPIQVVQEDDKQDTRVIQFTMPADQKMLTSKVHIVIPHLNYDHHYTTEMMFNTTHDNQKQPFAKQSTTSITPNVSDAQNKHGVESSGEASEHQPNHTSTPQAVPASATQHLDSVKPQQGIPYLMSTPPVAKVPSKVVKPVNKAQLQEELPLPELLPKFNRYADDKPPIKYTQTHSDVGRYLKRMNQIYLGGIIVLAAALLVGSMLYVRKGEGQSHDKKH